MSLATKNPISAIAGVQVTEEEYQYAQAWIESHPNMWALWSIPQQQAMVDELKRRLFEGKVQL